MRVSRIEVMDRGVWSWWGGRQMASEWTHSSEARPVSLSSLHPVPQPAAVRTRKAALPHKDGTHTHTHTHTHTQSPGIWAGEKIPWKIPENWAFESLEAGPCFKAKWAAFMLYVAPGWMASVPQVADKGGLKTPHVSGNWYIHCSEIWTSLCDGFVRCCMSWFCVF